MDELFRSIIVTCVCEFTRVHRKHLLSAKKCLLRSGIFSFCIFFYVTENSKLRYTLVLRKFKDKVCILWEFGDTFWFIVVIDRKKIKGKKNISFKGTCGKRILVVWSCNDLNNHKPWISCRVETYLGNCRTYMIPDTFRLRRRSRIIGNR